MKKIFEDAKDLHVSATILFVDANNYACVDEEAETKASKDELIDAFKKGLLITTETGMVRPYILTVDDDYASVSYDDGTSLVEIYSDGYVAAAAGTE